MTLESVILLTLPFGRCEFLLKVLNVDVFVMTVHNLIFFLTLQVKTGEQSWRWGLGRPGWHIECSAMSAYYLGFKFDSRGGGIDLIFPHHENENAQSGAACQESNVRYWMHNGHVTIDNEKMSKSSGKFFTIREVSQVSAWCVPSSEPQFHANICD